MAIYSSSNRWRLDAKVVAGTVVVGATVLATRFLADDASKTAAQAVVQQLYQRVKVVVQKFMGHFVNVPSPLTTFEGSCRCERITFRVRT